MIRLFSKEKSADFSNSFCVRGGLFAEVEVDNVLGQLNAVPFWNRLLRKKLATTVGVIRFPHNIPAAKIALLNILSCAD